MADPRLKRLRTADRERCERSVDELLGFGLGSFTVQQLKEALKLMKKPDERADLDAEEEGVMVSVRVSGLAGNVYTERQFEVGLSIGELKETLKPVIFAKFSEETVLTLFFDGNEVDDNDTLATLGFDESKDANFTALIYDPHALARMQINALHREAIEKSHQEAEAAREELQRLRQRRTQLIAEQKEKAEAEFAARQDWPPGPLLMLTAEPADVASKSQYAKVESPAQLQGPYLMLEDEAANTPADSENVLKVSSNSDADPSALHAVHADRPSLSALETTEIADWHAKASQVAESYDSFFDHISFRKGWKEPPFTREEVAPLFITAGRIVSRARIEILDARNTGIKIRQIEGSARDWMHSPCCASLLQENQELFLKGLVHATFKDAKGYVEGLDESEVDRFIELFS